MANLLSAAVLASIPLGHMAQMLSVAFLITVNFAATGMIQAEGLALMSYLPALVPAEQLARANARYFGTLSMAQIIGPAVAGLLVARFSPPGAIAFDAGSFVVTALLILLLPVVPLGHRPATAPLAALRAGIAVVLADPVLRLVTITAMTLNLVTAAMPGLTALFIVGRLHIPASWYGAALAIGGGGAVCGSLCSPQVGRRFSPAALLPITILLFIVTRGGIAMLHGATSHAAIGFGLCIWVNGFASGTLQTVLINYIQTAAPKDMLASVFGAVMTAFSVAVPLGALAGGALANLIGIRGTFAIAVCGYAGILPLVVATSRARLERAT